MKRVKISDVAQMAGVSKSTISNYLNGRYENMSPETRKRIAEAIEKLNYTPNISARRLSAKLDSNAVCIVIPMNIARTFETFYYPTALSSVGKESAKVGYNVLIHARAGVGKAKEIEYLLGMAGTIADGFLLFDIKQDDHYFEAFARLNIPYVCVGKIEGYEDYNYVATDHKTAVQEGLEHLIGLGHTKIAFINEAGGSVVSGVRRTGIEETLAKHSIPLEDRYFVYVEQHTAPNNRKNYETCRALLEQPDPPTAIISPPCAVLGIEQATQEMGLCIPKDISVLVLDYNRGYNFQFPSYTHFPSIVEKVSSIAFEKLYSYIQNREEGFTSELLPVHMVLGDSTAPPSSGKR